MPSQLTVTLPSGPGITNTAVVLKDVTEVTFRLRAAGMDKQVLQVNQENPLRISEYDLDVAATVTYTISGQNSTIAVST